MVRSGFLLPLHVYGSVCVGDVRIYDVSGCCVSVCAYCSCMVSSFTSTFDTAHIQFQVNFDQCTHPVTTVLENRLSNHFQQYTRT